MEKTKLKLVEAFDMSKLVDTKACIQVDGWVKITENFYHTTAIFEIDKPMDMKYFYDHKISINFVSESGTCLTDKIEVSAMAYNYINGKNVVMVNLITDMKFFEPVNATLIYYSRE